jgi:hypothetical protein
MPPQPWQHATSPTAVSRPPTYPANPPLAIVSAASMNKPVYPTNSASSPYTLVASTNTPVAPAPTKIGRVALVPISARARNLEVETTWRAVMLQALISIAVMLGVSVGKGRRTRC